MRIKSKTINLALHAIMLSVAFFNLENAVAATPDVTTCFPTALPTTPKQPNYSMTNTDSYGGSIQMTFWRETCKDGSGKVALLMKATPKTTQPYLNFGQTIIQGGFQYTSYFRNVDDGSVYGTLYVPTVAFIDVSATAFTPTKGFTFIYEGFSGTTTTKIDIPAGTGGTLPPNIKGSVSGYKSYNVICKNITTGKNVTIPLRTLTTWDCGKAGLPIRTGDKIQEIITGIAN